MLARAAVARPVAARPGRAGRAAARALDGAPRPRRSSRSGRSRCSSRRSSSTCRSTTGSTAASRRSPWPTSRSRARRRSATTPSGWRGWRRSGSTATSACCAGRRVSRSRSSARWLLWRSRRERLGRLVPEQRDAEHAAFLALCVCAAQVARGGVHRARARAARGSRARSSSPALPCAVPLVAWGLRHAPRRRLGAGRADAGSERVAGADGAVGAAGVGRAVGARWSLALARSARPRSSSSPPSSSGSRQRRELRL